MIIVLHRQYDILLRLKRGLHLHICLYTLPIRLATYALVN